MKSKRNEKQNPSKTSGEKPNESMLESLVSAEGRTLSKDHSTYEREPIDNTPFWIVGNEKEGFIITLGKHRVSKTIYKDKETAKLGLEKDKWDIVFNTAIAIYLMNEEAKLMDAKEPVDYVPENYHELG